MIDTGDTSKGGIDRRLLLATTVLFAWSCVVTLVWATSSQGRYVGSSGSEVFHDPSCKWAQKIRQENRVYFSSYDEAIRMGRRPCKVCRPSPRDGQLEAPTEEMQPTQQVIVDEERDTQPPEAAKLNQLFIIFVVVMVVLCAVTFMLLRHWRDRITVGILAVVFTVMLFMILHSPVDMSSRRQPSHKYTAARLDEVFHESSCYLTNGILDRHKEYFSTFDAAIDSGRIPCEKCLTSGGQAKVRIAFWNIRKFSNRSRNDDELRKICNILKKYDMIAVAELLDVTVLQRAVSMLEGMGRTYGYEASQPIGRTAKEQYAFLYDYRCFEVVRPGRVWADLRDDFVREPYYATFRAGNFDFTMVVIHVIYDSNDLGPGDEIPELGRIYTGIQDEDKSEQDVILAGDFNMAPDGVSFDNLKAIRSMMHLFKLPDTTNIADTKLYDNFWFQARYVREYAVEKGVDRFDETEFHNDDEAASLAVSDHRPIWASFYVDKEDDDGTTLP